MHDVLEVEESSSESPVSVRSHWTLLGSQQFRVFLWWLRESSEGLGACLKYSLTLLADTHGHF
jgi:hypothetical protein